MRKLEVEHIVLDLLRRRSGKARTALIDEHTNLLASGIVDSFSFMELLTEIENRLGIQLDIGAYEFDVLTTLGGLRDAVVETMAS